MIVAGPFRFDIDLRCLGHDGTTPEGTTRAVTPGSRFPSAAATRSRKASSQRTLVTGLGGQSSLHNDAGADLT
jgi:hypothetical protein